MFSIKVTTVDATRKVEQAAETGQFKSFSRAAFSISQDAKSSIRQSQGPSEPGEPPHTHRRVFLRRAIRYKASKEGAVIGPRASIVGQAGHAHEFGGKFRGQEYPARPFMRPALERAIPRFAGSWRGSIGS